MKFYRIFGVLLVFLLLPASAFAQVITELNIIPEQKTDNGEYYYTIKGTISSNKFDKTAFDNGNQAYLIAIGRELFDIKKMGWGVPIVDEATGRYALQIFGGKILDETGSRNVSLSVDKYIGDETLILYNYNFDTARATLDAEANGEVVTPPPVVTGPDDECTIPEDCTELENENTPPMGDIEELDEPTPIIDLNNGVTPIDNNVNIVPKEINEAGQYVYTISGEISEQDLASEALVNSNGVDYLLLVQEDGKPYDEYCLEGCRSPINMVVQRIDADGDGDYTLKFTYDVVLDKKGPGKVRIWKAGLVNSGDLVEMDVNFDTMRSELEHANDDPDGDGVPNITDTDDDGDGILDVNEAPVVAAPAVGSPSVSVVSPDCGSWVSENAVAVCFAQWGSMASIFLIGVGVVGSILLLPFVGYLLASGEPGNIEKGWEIFNSWFWGLMLLLLSGYIINIVGKDLFGVS